MISATQLRMARAMVSLSQAKVAEQLGVVVSVLSKIEKEQTDPPISRLKQLQSFYEGLGIAFTENDGVKRKSSAIRTLEGQEGFWQFYDDVYATIKEHGGEILVSNVDERDFKKWMGERTNAHITKMTKLLKERNFFSKILIKEGDYDLTASDMAEYRWTPKERFSEIPFYIYGEKLAIIDFEQNNVSIFIIDNKKITEAYKKQFEIIWDQAIIIPELKTNTAE